MTPTVIVLPALFLAFPPAIAFQNRVVEPGAGFVRVSEGAGRAEAARPQAAARDQGRGGGDRDRGDNPQTGGAVQRGDRPRGDNPPTGQATPRESRPAPRDSRPDARDSRPSPPPPARERRGGYDGNGRTNIYIAPPPTYNSYYYPRRAYPYGYSGFGLGYLYYDPYTWYPPRYYGGGYYPGYAGGYYDIGEIRLSVSPRFADVYVDGYYAGRVDDYDGVFQALKLESGAHHIQIMAPAFAPLDFDVRMDPGQKIIYRGDLRPFRP